MLLHCGLVLLFLNCVKTTEHYDYPLDNIVTELDQRFSYWPSEHNDANLMRLRKREAQAEENAGPKVAPKEVIHSEGGVEGSVSKLPPIAVVSTIKPTPIISEHPPEVKGNPKDEKPDVPKVSVVVNATEATTVASPVAINNVTSTKVTTSQLTNPGVLKRGVIVFGGFLLLAVAYFIFYRRKSNKNDASSMHNMNDANQFRYGVLQSEDRRGHLELSRVPLTMESDEDEDEDLEIFDLEQKKKSLSYVNLQTNDEDIVFNTTENSRENDKDNLLLDIEDAATDTLINWSNNGNKSIL